MWAYREKVAKRMSGRELLPEIDLAGTLILDFWTQELWENKFLLFKPSSLRYFVIKAWAD